MTDTPEDWVLREGAKRCGRGHWSIGDLTTFYRNTQVYRALCDMIFKHEQPPVDRKLLCAREAHKWCIDVEGTLVEGMVHAIELWEEGYGK
jgi:hypothetical protein